MNQSPQHNYRKGDLTKDRNTHTHMLRRRWKSWPRMFSKHKHIQSRTYGAHMSRCRWKETLAKAVTETQQGRTHVTLPLEGILAKAVTKCNALSFCPQHHARSGRCEHEEPMEGQPSHGISMCTGKKKAAWTCAPHRLSTRTCAPHRLCRSPPDVVAINASGINPFA